ncbi:MAG TPA: hypothetical protein VJM12_03340 [Pyrinomonadaceae bacterium]|nr:hypothetical protein [Pyrinomonadaceae bacterium]
MRTHEILRSRAFVAVTLLLCSTAPDATASTRQPVVDGIIRDGGPFGAKDGIGDVVLDGSVVQTLHVPAFEDRGIIEFNLAGLSQPIRSGALFS